MFALPLFGQAGACCSFRMLLWSSLFAVPPTWSRKSGSGWLVRGPWYHTRGFRFSPEFRVWGLWALVFELAFALGFGL